MRALFLAILVVHVVSPFGRARAAERYDRWYKSKRAKNNKHAVFSAENGPFAKIYIVARRKGRFLVDLLYDRKGKPRMSAAFWSPDGTRVALQLLFEGKRVMRVYDTATVDPVRELDRHPERYLLQLGWVGLAKTWGWPKARLAALETVKGLEPLARGSLAWYLALARFYEKGGYLARFLVTLHLRTEGGKATIFDPKRRDGDVVARLTTALLVRFEGCKPNGRRLLERFDKAFVGRGIAFYQQGKELKAGGSLRIETHPRNRFEAKKLADFLSSDPSLLSRKSGGALTVERRVSERLPLHEIRVILL
ncbi:MAG: hypothetical protein KC609_09830 [Myxococcales bacterium]|nr:hypothetical protein [Myxococcales bacterium]